MPEVPFQWAKHIPVVVVGKLVGCGGVPSFHLHSLKMGTGVQELCGTSRLGLDWLWDPRQMV